MATQYFGPERRRRPRNAHHTFATVLIRTADCWLAREVLVLDSSAETARVRTLPNLLAADFRVRLEGSDDHYSPTIERAEPRGDFWEFTMRLGPGIASADLGPLPVIYDFPCAAASE